MGPVTNSAPEPHHPIAGATGSLNSGYVALEQGLEQAVKTSGSKSYRQVPPHAFFTSLTQHWRCHQLFHPGLWHCGHLNNLARSIFEPNLKPDKKHQRHEIIEPL